MNITIIGCGYIGASCATSLRKQGHIITATTTTPSRIDHLTTIANKAVLLQGDDLKGMTALLKGQDAVILSVAAGRDGDYKTTYIKTTDTLSKALARSPSVQQLLYTSSSSVYGECQGDWVEESRPLAPLNASGVALCLAEHALLSSISPELELCILRLGEIYGPSREIINRLRNLNGAKVPGSGNNFTNLIHRDDVVNAISFALDRNLTGVYNLCNGVHISRKELYDSLCLKEGLQRVEWDVTQTPVHGGNRRLSMQKLKEAGFSTQISSVQ